MKGARPLVAVGLLALSVPAFSSSISSAASLIPPCSNTQLIVLGSGLYGALGTGFMAIDIANKGASCRIGGYPVIEFINANGVVVDQHDIHESSMVFAEPRDVTMTLVHGSAASFGVSWSDNVVNNEPYNTTCPKTSSVSVTLNGGVGHLSQGLQVEEARPCNDAIWVTPIEPEAWPRPNE